MDYQTSNPLFGRTNNPWNLNIRQEVPPEEGLLLSPVGYLP